MVFLPAQFKFCYAHRKSLIPAILWDCNRYTG